jgi:hypothetical protein
MEAGKSREKRKGHPNIDHERLIFWRWLGLPKGAEIKVIKWFDSTAIAQVHENKT